MQEQKVRQNKADRASDGERQKEREIEREREHD